MNKEISKQEIFEKYGPYRWFLSEYSPNYVVVKSAQGITELGLNIRAMTIPTFETHEQAINWLHEKLNERLNYFLGYHPKFKTFKDRYNWFLYKKVS